MFFLHDTKENFHNMRTTRKTNSKIYNNNHIIGHDQRSHTVIIFTRSVLCFIILTHISNDQNHYKYYIVNL